MFKLKIKDKVKVIELIEEQAMNLWGGYDDLSGLLDQTGTVTSIINPDTEYERYGIEFDNDFAQMTRERTGIIFSANQLDIINTEFEKNA